MGPGGGIGHARRTARIKAGERRPDRWRAERERFRRPPNAGGYGITLPAIVNDAVLVAYTPTK